MSYCTQNVEAEYIDYLENEYVTKEGSTIITRDNGNDSIEEKCPSCGNWYKKIGVHWVNGSCSIPPISEKKYQMIVGLIMGDGCINNGNKNCFAQIYNSNITFLKYLDEVFGWLSNGIEMRKTAYQCAKDLNNRGIDGETYNTNPEDCLDQYILLLRTHPVFNDLREWYKDGVVVFKSVKYTPKLLRMWYASDGGINKGEMRIEFSSVNESSTPDVIINQFRNIGVKINHHKSSSRFRVSQHDKDKFFNYIGHDPVPGFEYKWEYQDQDEYERLKNGVKSKHTTQTLEKEV